MKFQDFADAFMNFLYRHVAWWPYMMFGAFFIIICIYLYFKNKD